MNPNSRLLRLPHSARCALSAVARLARLEDGTFHMLETLSAPEAQSVSYLAKILRRLARGGVLESRRGARGGYRLARPAVEITLDEVVAAASSPEDGAPVCMMELRECGEGRPCALHEFVKKTEAAIRRTLRATTVDEYLRMA